MDVRYAAFPAENDRWEYTESFSSGRNGSMTPTVTIKKKRIIRPKSVPPSLRGVLSRPDMQAADPNRPRTALGTNHQECDRLLELEHEPTRKHAFESHLPPRKNKPPPWQKSLDVSPTPCVIAPGYMLARSKNKVSVIIKTDELFDHEQMEKPVAKEGNDCSGQLIAELQQQIDDLTLHLEEERLNHKETKRKTAEILKDKIDDLNHRHGEAMRKLKEQTAEEIEELRKIHKTEMENLQSDSESLLHKLRGEVEFLQGAFESYKSQILEEMADKWEQKEKSLALKNERLLQDQLRTLRTTISVERNNEKAELDKAHRQEINNLKKEHKKDLENLEKKYKSFSSDHKLLVETTQQLEQTQKALSDLQKEYDSLCHQVTETTRDLTDTKLKLLNLEESFQDKVQAVDENYHQQIHDLMSQNTELRRLYMKKCGELFDEKVVSDAVRNEHLENAKNAMKVVIQTRKNADISIAALDPETDSRPKTPKERPISAPGTRGELTTAQVSAGETQAIEHAQSRPMSCKPRFLDQIIQDNEAAWREEEGEDEGLIVRGKSRRDLQKYLNG